MLVQAITYKFHMPSFSCLKLLLELTKHQSDYYYTLTSPPFSLSQFVSLFTVMVSNYSKTCNSPLRSLFAPCLQPPYFF